MLQRRIIRFRIAGACGILTPVVAFLFISLSIGSASEFSWVKNALSDLGVMPGLTSTLFNYGLVISGILGFVFATSLSGLMRFGIPFADGKQRYLTNWDLGGAWIFSLACLALIAIGVFPENVRFLHNFASVAFFVLLIGSLLYSGVEFWRVRQTLLATLTLLLSVAAAVPWLLLFFNRYVSGVAIPEFISALAGGLWTAVFGYEMLKTASKLKEF